MPVGFRVFLKRELPSPDIVEAFKSLPPANVADCMGRLCALSSQIRLLSSPDKPIMAGVALTVKARPGDNLMIHKALNMAGPGDVIVVSNEGDRSQSLVGEIIVTYAQYKGLAGLVFDGPIRDIDAISEMGIPVYGTGTTPGGPYKEGPGEVNVPIACGGIHIEPGDILLGDADGVIVIPKRDAAGILAAARAFSASDRAKVEAAANGTADRAWVDKTLAAKNCEIVDAIYGA
ncbi:MAG TPA: RraA family protein [Spirochaetia bacterium]|nr:RraA family protein [Spirochaetia bacterium]HRZ65709.1 RraA family protein [Spirochaetia bacterium]